MIEYAQILEKEFFCGNIVKFVLRAPRIASEAKCGQYLMLRCSGEQILRRPISIARITGDDLMICFEIRGAGTLFLSHREEGDVLDIMGPSGNGFSLESAKGSLKKSLVAGGGLGIYPLLQITKELPFRCDAALSFRSAARVNFVAEFERSSRVFLSTDDGSAGRRGSAGDLVRELLEKEDYAEVFVCGPKPMMRAVARLAEEFGIPCQVSLEEHMACGVGTCLGCVCKTESGQRRVCKDGPVFRSNEVKWE